MLFRKLQIAILLLCGMTLLATTVLPHHHRDDGAICLLIFENDSHDCASHAHDAPSPCTPGCDHGCEGDDCPSRVSEIDISSAKSFWYMSPAVFSLCRVIFTPDLLQPVLRFEENVYIERLYTFRFLRTLVLRAPPFVA